MRILLAMGVLLGFGCGDGVVGVVTSSPSLPFEVLRAAPTSLSTGSRAFAAGAYVWRDFMPGNTDSSLTVVARVGSEDGAPLPFGASIVRLWVLRDGTAWETDELEEGSSDAADRIEVVAPGGPTWDTGITVDVVLEVRGLTSEPVLLRVPDVEIERTS